jgi:SAM-dependent methyltransferase
MTNEPSPSTGLDFGEVALAYDQARPGYPIAAAQWLVASPADETAVVLELGAGTGKLTAQLTKVVKEVLATDPDERMLELLSHRVPQARTAAGGAEEINLPDRAVDVIAIAQALHWFDLDRAIPEMARVLRSDGVVGMVWNYRDDSIPWVRKLDRMLGSQDSAFDLPEFLADRPEVVIIDQAEFRHWQSVDREQLTGFVSSRSEVIALSPEARAEKLAEVIALYDEYDRGGGLQLPWISRCYRARFDLAARNRPAGEPAPTYDDDDGMLLIDFK